MRGKGRGGYSTADKLSMKINLKNFTINRYIRYVKHQNKHIQHIHGFIFAGIITSAIAFVVLYTDYGFWHETYIAEDALNAGGSAYVSESPSQSFSRFWSEAKEQFGRIGSTGANLLEGKDTYIKEQ
jgi:hypothetical protein